MQGRQRHLLAVGRELAVGGVHHVVLFGVDDVAHDVEREVAHPFRHVDGLAAVLAELGEEGVDFVADAGLVVAEGFLLAGEVSDGVCA